MVCILITRPAGFELLYNISNDRWVCGPAQGPSSSYAADLCSRPSFPQILALLQRPQRETRGLCAPALNRALRVGQVPAAVSLLNSALLANYTGAPLAAGPLLRPGMALAPEKLEDRVARDLMRIYPAIIGGTFAFVLGFMNQPGAAVMRIVIDRASLSTHMMFVP
jgi:hypothetical protein